MMSKLDELIQRLCPDGVEYKILSDLFEQFSGMTGVSNKWAESGNCVFIDYLNTYSNLKIDTTALKNATVKNLKQTELIQGDILLTCASETPDECAISSVIEQTIQNNVFLDDHLFGLRLKPDYKKIINTTFVNYVFHSEFLRKKIRKAVRGVTRFYISNPAFMKITIPVPPIEVQDEIVRILDNFTELSAELSAELKARKKQFEYYRRFLLDSKNKTQMIPLRNIIKKSCSGATPAKGNPEYYECGTVPWLRTQDVRFNEIYQIDNFITEKAVRETATKWIPPNCVIVAISGATAGRCAINKIATTTNQHCLNMEIDSKKALYKYVFYCVCDKYEELLSKKQGARGDLNSSLILSLQIPLPSLKEQERIVALLDCFDSLCNNLSDGLPAEIAARQKQYEYYRDKLLTFKERS